MQFETTQVFQSVSTVKGLRFNTELWPGVLVLINDYRGTPAGSW